MTFDDRDGIGPGGKPYTIVICDDNESETRMLQQLLETHGYHVLGVFGNGRQLLNWYKSHPGTTDLVILDIIMPVLDGFAAFWELKSMHPFTRVVFMSVENSSAVIKHLLNNGAYDYITKPINRVKILDRIKAVVRRPPPR